MKKIISLALATMMLLLCTVTAFAAGGTTGTDFGAYKHVIIVGIDGLGAAWQKTEAPNCKRIFADGALRYDARAELETTSAQNWGSILCGVSYLKHGFKNDDLSANERTSDTENHSIFYYVRRYYRDAELVSFNNWSAINHGVIENDIGVKKINSGNDDAVVQSIVDYFEEGNQPTLMFVQLDEVDHAGHAHGGFSLPYYQAAAKADDYLGAIYDAAKANGTIDDDALFIVVADHGETADGHGGPTLEESAVVLGVAGKSVGKTSMPGYVNNRDVAAIALYALGIEQPSHMTAMLPAGVFNAHFDTPTQLRRSVLTNWRKTVEFIRSIGDFFKSLFTGTMFMQK